MFAQVSGLLDVSTVSVVVAGISVVIGVIFANGQLRELVKARHTDLVWRLHSDFNEKEMLEALAKIWNLEYRDYKEFVGKYGSPLSGNPAPIALLKLSNFFEGVGVLLNRHLVDVDLVAQILPVEPVWKKVQTLVEGMRQETGEQSTYEWFEYLYNEFRRKNKSRTNP